MYSYRTITTISTTFVFPPIRYGLSNCLFAATYDQILDQCRCVPFFHTMAYNDYPHICAGPSLRCMNKILRDIGSHTHVKVERPGGQVTDGRSLHSLMHLMLAMDLVILVEFVILTVGFS